MMWVWSDFIVSSVLILYISSRDFLLPFEISRVTYEFIAIVPSMTPHTAVTALHCLKTSFLSMSSEITNFAVRSKPSSPRATYS